MNFCLLSNQQYILMTYSNLSYRVFQLQALQIQQDSKFMSSSSLENLVSLMFTCDNLMCSALRYVQLPQVVP